MEKRIQFIGGGNMAQALISGLRASGHAGDLITVVEPDAEKRAYLEKSFDVITQSEAKSIEADLCVLAVKPQIMQSVVTHCRTAEGVSFLSIAAGITVDAISSWLPEKRTVIRAMPNTPSLVGKGMTGLWADTHALKTEKEIAEYVMLAVGKVLWVETETELDMVTAVSGSGPAYVFQLAELMANAGVQLGLTPVQAKELANQTLVGAAEMLARSTQTATTLRQNVTSKGGTTEAALNFFTENGIADLYNGALKAAYDRAGELAKQLASSTSSKD